MGHPTTAVITQHHPLQQKRVNVKKTHSLSSSRRFVHCFHHHHYHHSFYASLLLHISFRPCTQLMSFILFDDETHTWNVHLKISSALLSMLTPFLVTLVHCSLSHFMPNLPIFSFCFIVGNNNIITRYSYAYMGAFFILVYDASSCSGFEQVSLVGGCFRSSSFLPLVLLHNPSPPS